MSTARTAVSADRAGAEGTPRAVRLEARVRAWQAVARQYFPSGRVLVTTHFPFASVSGRQRALHDALLAKNYGASRVLVAHLRGERDLLTAAADCYLPGELGIQLLLAARGAMSDRVGACTVHTAPDGDGTVDLAAAIEKVRTGGATSLFRPEAVEIIRSALAATSE